MSQDCFKFENLLSNFEKVLSDTTLCNSSFTIILGDFNASGLETKLPLKGHNLNLLEVSMGFVNLYHNPLTNYYIFPPIIFPLIT